MTGLLRAEAAALALLLGAALWVAGPPWWLAVAVLAAPDLSMLGYLAGPVIGARIYNAAHAVIGPCLLAAAAWAGLADLWLWVAGLWALHIALDRALGYGLKHESDFRDTHLGRIGR